MKTIMKTLSADIVSNFTHMLNFDILSISYLDEKSDKKSPRSIMSSYKLLVMIEGQAGVHIGKNIFYTQKGDCVLFAPGSIYHAEILGKERCKFISINFNVSAEQNKMFLYGTALKDIAVYPKAVPISVMKSLYETMENAISEKEGYYLDTVLILKKLLGIIMYRKHGNIQINDIKLSTSGEEEIVINCQRYITNNVSTAVTVEELCRVCNVSQSYLYKCFKSVLGISCKEFITSTKLDIAARALLQTNKSIGQVALENGFSNAYQFSNVFKKFYGMSPSAYRNLDK